jgi:hypothetical protein
MLTRIALFFVLLLSVTSAVEIPVSGVSLSLRRDTAGQYVFVVRNSGAKPIFYSGYGGSEASSPIFAVEMLEAGQWKSAQLGWCGTGLGQSFLRANRDFSQPIHPGISFEIRPGTKFRVSMNFSTERYVAGTKRVSTTIHSNPIEFVPHTKRKG